ncbi:sigma-70 RNA polymerase sigma factor region 4 domain-containing protein [Streptomyces hydrogenans]|uniref:hypothetical protein n=1 Tax=Streptomyces hydrogenans TaxID=1873719 RepID=UPI00367E9F3A
MTLPASRGRCPGPRPPAFLMGYRAFCLRNENRYLRYARARSLDPGRARVVVDSLLCALVDEWPRIIASDRPASEAWKMLVLRVAASVGEGPRAHGGRRDTVHQTLEGLEADVFVLRYRMSLSPAETADLMGLEVPEVTVALRRGMSMLLGPRELIRRTPARPTQRQSI